jgi:hypothetical protein
MVIGQDKEARTEQLVHLPAEVQRTEEFLGRLRAVDKEALNFPPVRDAPGGEGRQDL